MSDQTLGISDEVLNIRWANDDPTIGSQAIIDKSQAQINAADKILNKWGSTTLWEVANDGQYPNTDTQYAEYEAIIKRSGLPPGLTPKPNSLAAMASQYTPDPDTTSAYPGFEQMTPEQQEYYKNYFAQYMQMTPEQQQEYYNNYYAQEYYKNFYAQMTPEQQEYYKNYYTQMTPEQQNEYNNYYKSYTESLSNIATAYGTEGGSEKPVEQTEVKNDEKKNIDEIKTQVPIIATEKIHAKPIKVIEQIEGSDSDEEKPQKAC